MQKDRGLPSHIFNVLKELHQYCQHHGCNDCPYLVPDDDEKDDFTCLFCYEPYCWSEFIPNI